jgi:hypothetical protein
MQARPASGAEIKSNLALFRRESNAMTSKYFNTLGVCNPQEHYMLPAVPRLPGIGSMIDSGDYFIINAPRQSGKTTCLTELTTLINSEGKYYALNCSFSSISDTNEDDMAMSRVIDCIDAGLRSSSVPKLRDLACSFIEEPYMKCTCTKVQAMLFDICRSLDRKLVVFFDEADCLNEAHLRTFLLQIRSGHDRRFAHSQTGFPRSLALVGMSNIRYYLTTVWPEEWAYGIASNFNIVVNSISPANFSMEEIWSLYGQHTVETGQIFEPDAVERAWYWTEGQPWMVNAIADDVVVNQFKNDHSKVITAKEIDVAVRDLILRNDTHLDYLSERLKETRVRRVMERIIVGANIFPDNVSSNDERYAIDLGILRVDSATGERYKPANPVYSELIARTLSRDIRKSLPRDLASRWMDGTGIDMDGLLKDFQIFWRNSSKALTELNVVKTFVKDSVNSVLEEYRIKDVDENLINFKYIDKTRYDIVRLSKDAFAHLAFFAFLQRAMNDSVGIMKIEYGLNNSKLVICVCYKGISYPLELKIKGVKSQENNCSHLSGYIDRCGSKVGWLIVFDNNFMKSWDSKLFWNTIVYEGKTIHEVGC